MEKELYRIDVIMQRGNLSGHDRELLYGARQALGWLLGRNYLKASRCLTTDKAQREGA